MRCGLVITALCVCVCVCVCRGMKASSVFWEQQLILRCSAVDRNDPEETKKQINDEEDDSV